MKAIVFENYGSPDMLRLQEVAKPAPKENQVLVRVFASSVNYNTVALVTGKPLIARLMTGGMLKPKYKTPGNDIAGKVEAVGKNVTAFKPGDDVFGDLSDYGFGAFAEYIAVPEKALARKPANISFEEAAAAPESALVALQGLRDMGQIQAGQKVLINGASGGIGSFAVQIAKVLGAEVTGVCGTRNLGMVRSLGADYVIDYTREDFVQNGQQYDLIFDVAAHRSIVEYQRALTPKGIYVMAGGSIPRILQAIVLGALISRKNGKKLGAFMVRPNKDLPFMAELLESGKVHSVIDQCYSWTEAGKALQQYATSSVRGKIVISMQANGVS